MFIFRCIFKHLTQLIVQHISPYVLHFAKLMCWSINQTLAFTTMYKLKVLMHIVLTIPFLYLSFKSINRYFLFQIAVANTPIEMIKKQFPSISICPQYPFKNYFRGNGFENIMTVLSDLRISI